MLYNKLSFLLAVIIVFSLALIGCTSSNMSHIKTQASTAWTSFKSGLTKNDSANSNSSNSSDYIGPTVDTTPLVSRYNAIGLIDYCKEKGIKPINSHSVREKLVSLVHEKKKLSNSKYYREGRQGTAILNMRNRPGPKGIINTYTIKFDGKNQYGESVLKDNCKAVAVAAKQWLITGRSYYNGQVQEIKEK